MTASTLSLPQHDGDIAAADSRPASMVQAAPLHLLKFNYDATTPLVNISLSIHPNQKTDDGKGSALEEDIKLVYRGTHEGGFNQVFSLPAQAALDLSDAIASPSAQIANESASILDGDGKSAGNTHILPVARQSHSEDTNRSSLERSMGNMHVEGATQPDLATVPEVGGLNTTSDAQTTPQESTRTPRRFSIFARRQREPDVEEAAQIEMTNRAENTAENQAKEHKEPENGMRLLIKIEAVGPEGELSMKAGTATLLKQMKQARLSSGTTLSSHISSSMACGYMIPSLILARA